MNLILSDKAEDREGGHAINSSRSIRPPSGTKTSTRLRHEVVLTRTGPSRRSPMDRTKGERSDKKKAHRTGGGLLAAVTLTGTTTSLAPQSGTRTANRTKGGGFTTLSVAQKTKKLRNAQGASPSGPGRRERRAGFNMWRDRRHGTGVVCRSSVSRVSTRRPWPGAGVISEQKANHRQRVQPNRRGPGGGRSASSKALLSTANLYRQYNPGGSCSAAGEQPVEVVVAYGGDATRRAGRRSMVGKKTWCEPFSGGGIAALHEDTRRGGSGQW